MLLEKSIKLPVNSHDCTYSHKYRTELARGPLLDRVYTLRHKSYSQDGYIDENPSGKMFDMYDGMANSDSYLIYDASQAIASIRICVFDPKEKLTIPCHEIFSKEINQHLGFEVKYAEINKFVVDPAFQRKGGLRARFEVFNAMAKKTLYDDLDYVVMAVRPSHVKFYSRVFDCEPISEEKSYPGLSFKTVLLVMRNIQSVRDLLSSKTTLKSERNEPILNRINC